MRLSIRVFGLRRFHSRKASRSGGWSIGPTPIRGSPCMPPVATGRGPGAGRAGRPGSERTLPPGDASGSLARAGARAMGTPVLTGLHPIRDCHGATSRPPQCRKWPRRWRLGVRPPMSARRRSRGNPHCDGGLAVTPHCPARASPDRNLPGARRGSAPRRGIVSALRILMESEDRLNQDVPPGSPTFPPRRPMAASQQPAASLAWRPRR